MALPPAGGGAGYLPEEKFEWRVVELSAKARTAVLTRTEALEALKTPPHFETDKMVNYCLQKQGMLRDEYDAP